MHGGSSLENVRDWSLHRLENAIPHLMISAGAGPDAARRNFVA